jgi:hypothetical protein
MTAILSRVGHDRPRNEIWNSMPGWGLAANLTPPELIAARRLSRIRKRLLVAVLLVMVGSGVGTGFAYLQANTAQSGLDAANATTARLRQQETQYSQVTKLKGSIAAVKQQVASLMATDVDVTGLINSLQQALPHGAGIEQLSVTFDSTGPGSTPMPGVGQSLDTSGKQHIGSVMITATGLRLTDASAYVVALGKVPGVVDVYPTSNVTQAIGTLFTVQLNLTNTLLTHRFAATTPKVTK